MYWHIYNEYLHGDDFRCDWTPSGFNTATNLMAKTSVFKAYSIL